MSPQSIHRFILSRDLLPEAAPVLVGLSGGADSVVLLHVLLGLGYAVRAAHVNYQLRGDDSDGDEAFVRALCARLGVPLDVARFDTEAIATSQGASVQAAARDLRYDYFGRLAREYGVQRIAVGHHLDDQVETVLINLFRGCGPEGLAGMAPKRPLGSGAGLQVVRPLLETRRSEIEEYAQAQELGWRTDATNESVKYRRGALRNEILPLVEDHFGPAALENVARSAALLREYVRFSLAGSVRAIFEACALAMPEGGGRLDLSCMRRQAPVWRRRLVLEALNQWLPGAPRRRSVAEKVEALLDAQPGRRVTLRQGTVWRGRGYLQFVPSGADGEPDAGATIDAMGGRGELPQGVVLVEELPERPATLDPGTKDVAYVDADCLEFPLQVRPWKAGDRFRPLGMDHSKKLSDFLTDERVAPHERSRTLVVVSGGEVVWVAGHRLSHDARVRPETRRFAKISFLSR